ncbi:BON domain-containing protein [Ancylobacter dichloromethanicus]|uniref:BON domain-containing protein n=1 Tax=Ancylobacter dichloromethanicus TaxID=518825 RepID=A0A9W6J955_9HYPH|nr:BON domain-containing protein [Ancylobacter dichloromethanicus]MBS7552655.1 BON domain-containing protein [Ancylobacter dichloromethanicus]GLK72018.1 hypothetical protein GCM10017643_21340 [Ancylobacter dichloromethanicus]
MQDPEFYQCLRQAVKGQQDGTDVEVGVAADKRIITLTGRVPTRGAQISIEDAVERLAGDFTVVNLVKVEPQLGRPAAMFH